MKLTLDHTQRLNLHALMGAQRVNVDDLRLFWRLQDRIDLTDDERKRIGYRLLPVNGQTQPTWNLDAPVAPIEYDFEQPEYDRIAKMVKEWQPGYLPTVDRRWMEPLLDQLASNGSNGQKK